MIKKNATPSKVAAPAKVVPTPSQELPTPSSKPKAPLGKGKGKADIHNVSAAVVRNGQSAKAGLQFSVPRVARFMKQGRYADRIGGGAPVYLASALQYIVSEIVELAGNEAQNAKKQRIAPRHVMLAIRNDLELNKLISADADFSATGVAPNIPKALLPNKKGKGGKGQCQADSDEEMAE